MSKEALERIAAKILNRAFKPRLHREGDKWICRDVAWYAVGGTPRESYDNWVWTTNQVMLTGSSFRKLTYTNDGQIAVEELTESPEPPAPASPAAPTG